MSLTAGEWIFTIVMGLLLLFAIISNILVCFCVFKYRKLRNVTNVFICNLAVSDILLAGFVLPARLHDISHTDEFHEGQALCRIINFVPILLITSSIFTLVCVSFERRRAVIESNKPQMTFKAQSRIIPLVWFLSIMVSVPTILEYRVNEITLHGDGNSTTIFLSCGSEHMDAEFSLANAITVALVSYLLPVILMFKNYFEVAKFVWKRGKQVHDEGSDQRARGNSHLFKARVKLVKLLVSVAVIFAVSWFPFFVMLLFAKITGNDASSNASGFVNLLLIALATFSTAYNVVLYVVFNPNFNRAIKDLLRCVRAEQTSSGSQAQTYSASPVARQGQSPSMK